MTPLVDTKVDVKYKDGGAIMEKIPKAGCCQLFSVNSLIGSTLNGFHHL